MTFVDVSDAIGIPGLISQLGVQVRGKGGLLVLGTNIHESRRSENQLKGRAARQGDPGETIMLFDLTATMMRYSPGSGMMQSEWCFGVPFDEDSIFVASQSHGDKALPGRSSCHVTESKTVLGSLYSAVVKEERKEKKRLHLSTSF